MGIEKFVRVEQHIMEAIIVDNRELKSLADEYKSRWLHVEELNKLLVEESDRRLELLREILDEVFPDDEYWPELFSRELIDRIAKEINNE